MIKLVCFFKRKLGMSLEEFRDYYENNHVPLIRSLLPLAEDYRRNYLQPGGIFTPAHLANPAAAPDFDVITEVWYRDRDAFEAMNRAFEDPAIGDAIREDEERFMNRDEMVMFLVDEECTSN